MTAEEHEARELLGAYVLGGLEPADRAVVESHLADCPSCREELASYAGLPAMLRLGDERPQDVAVEPGPDVLTRTLAELRRTRRRRRRLTVLAAAAAVVVTALALGPLGPPGSPSDDVGSTEASMPLAATAGSSAQGGARLTARPWGTAVELDLTGLPPGERFVVWLVSTDGTREQAATWGSTPDGVARVTGASALGREVVGAVRVTTTRGRLVLSRDV